MEAVPREEDFYDFEARYEIGRTSSSAPPTLPGRRRRAGRASWRSTTYRVLGCYGFARVDLMLDEATGELTVLEANVIPGLTDTSLLPLAAEAAGIGFEALIARVLELAVARAPA